MKYAAEAAEYIGSQHTEIIIDTDMVLSSLREVIGAMGTFDITTIRAGMGMYLVCKAIRETTDKLMSLLFPLFSIHLLRKSSMASSSKSSSFASAQMLPEKSKPDSS